MCILSYIHLCVYLFIHEISILLSMLGVHIHIIHVGSKQQEHRFRIEKGEGTYETIIPQSRKNAWKCTHQGGHYSIKGGHYSP